MNYFLKLFLSILIIYGVSVPAFGLSQLSSMNHGEFNPTLYPEMLAVDTIGNGSQTVVEPTRGKVTVTLHLEDNCNASTNASADPASTEADLKIFPNPNSGEFKIFLSTNEIIGEGVIRIISLNAKVVYSEKINCFSNQFEKKLKLPLLPEGSYYLELSTSEQLFMARLFVNH